MINLPRIVMVLFGLSSVVDIAEKIHNWGRDKKNEKEEKQDEPSRVQLQRNQKQETLLTEL